MTKRDVIYTFLTEIPYFKTVGTMTNYIENTYDTNI